MKMEMVEEIHFSSQAVNKHAMVSNYMFSEGGSIYWNPAFIHSFDYWKLFLIDSFLALLCLAKPHGFGDDQMIWSSVVKTALGFLWFVTWLPPFVISPSFLMKATLGRHGFLDCK